MSNVSPWPFGLFLKGPQLFEFYSSMWKNLSTNHFYHWIFSSLHWLRWFADDGRPSGARRPFQNEWNMLRDRSISLDLFWQVFEGVQLQHLLSRGYCRMPESQQRHNNNFPISYSGFPRVFFDPRQPVRSNEHGTLWCRELMMEPTSFGCLGRCHHMLSKKSRPGWTWRSEI